MIYSENIINNSLFIIMEESSNYHITKEEYDNFNIIDITITNGNIPIDKDLFGKYKTVREKFDNETVDDIKTIIINDKLSDFINNNLGNIKINSLKLYVQNIFYKFHNQSVFINNKSKIIINKSGLNESIEKIYNNRTQRSLLYEHLLVFSNLGNIISTSKLVNQIKNIKETANPDIRYWNYYLGNININGIDYKIEFDVRSMQDGQNQYRIQRLEKDIKKQIDYDGDINNALPPNSQPVSNNNISQQNHIVKHDISSNDNIMQNNKKDTLEIIKIK